MASGRPEIPPQRKSRQPSGRCGRLVQPFTATDRAPKGGPPHLPWACLCSRRKTCGFVGQDRWRCEKKCSPSRDRALSAGKGLYCKRRGRDGNVGEHVEDGHPLSTALPPVPLPPRLHSRPGDAVSCQLVTAARPLTPSLGMCIHPPGPRLPPPRPASLAASALPLPSPHAHSPAHAHAHTILTPTPHQA